MNRMVLRGAEVLLNDRLEDVDIAVQNGLIAQIGKNLEGDALRVDGRLVPGFIDEHIHGIHGDDTMQGAQAVSNMANHLVSHGVTSFLPTTMNAGAEETYAAVADIKRVMQEQTSGAEVVGAHMEGPFLGEKYKGAQDARANLLPSKENFARLTREAADIVRLITIAPELDGAQAFVCEITERGVAVSAGHTDASYETMEEAVRWGVSQVTHLFNGMNPLHHRAPGVPCAALTLEGLSPQVIADGVHLHPSVVKLAVRSGADILLITDAMMATDMEDGEYDLGGQTVYVRNGEARLAAGNLAGSTLTLERAVANVMRFTGLSLERVAPMASERVASALRLTDRGRIAVGLRADLCLLNAEMQVQKTFVAGHLMFERL